VVTDEAVEGYFHAYFDALHRYAFTLLKDNDDAKDAVQAVFLKLWEKRTGIDDRQSVKTYLYTAVYHYCLNIKRHLKVRSNTPRKAPMHFPPRMNTHQKRA